MIPSRVQRRALAAAATLWLALALPAAADDGADALAAGDAAWRTRGEGAANGRAPAEPILAAIEAYARTLDAAPESLEARWKLLRALHYAGEFAARDPQEAQDHFDRAREIAERGLDRLAERAGSDVRLDELPEGALEPAVAAAGASRDDVARLYFWSAIDWGAWTRNAGLLDAVRTGAANRIHRYALVAKRLEPGYEEGGVYRLLGSLHAGLPQVPFVTGWVDRDASIPLLERAYRLAPDHPGNALLLGSTLFELAPQRRDEAVALLEGIDELPIRDDMRVEDLAIRAEASERLAEIRAEEHT